jgi:hypothetical protein
MNKTEGGTDGVRQGNSYGTRHPAEATPWTTAAAPQKSVPKSRSTTRRTSGASSERSFASPLIPMVLFPKRMCAEHDWQRLQCQEGERRSVVLVSSPGIRTVHLVLGFTYICLRYSHHGQEEGRTSNLHASIKRPWWHQVSFPPSVFRC